MYYILVLLRYLNSAQLTGATMKRKIFFGLHYHVLWQLVPAHV